MKGKEKIIMPEKYEEKVYCNECRFFDKDDARHGKRVIDTKHFDSPIRLHKEDVCCEYDIDNHNNYCPHYEKKRWWMLI